MLKMDHKEIFFPQRDGLSTVDGQIGPSAIGAIATQDHAVIRQWASRHNAEPAHLDETTAGTPALQVSDGGTAVRFNFPAAGRFRPVTWDEWFEQFDRLRLTFVYEEEVADRAYELWQARGKTDGHDRDDWIEAEHRLEGSGGSPSARYRFLTHDDE
jgi:hypothetical protein